MKFTKLMFALLVLAAAATVRGDWLSDAGGIAAFAKYIELTVEYENGAGVADFPVLVRLSSAIPGFDYNDFTSADGRDLVFVSESQTVLPHEIDTWDTTGESLVWVRVPSIAKGDRFYAYYGNAGVASVPPPPAEFKNAVWSGYAGVWHMGERFESSDAADAKTAYDSTDNGLHAEAKDTNNKLSQMVPYDNGAVGVARVNQSSNSQKGAYLSVPSYNNLNLGGNFTMSAWLYYNAVSNYPRPISRKDKYNSNNGWELETSNNSTTSMSVRGAAQGAGTINYASGSLTSGWHHYVWVFDGKSVTSYQDGSLVATVTMGAAATDNGLPLSFGSNSNGSEYCLNGQYDEMRLRGGSMSAAQVKAEFDTVYDHGFLSYEAGSMDATKIYFVGAATYAVDGQAVSFSVDTSAGQGALAVVFADVATGDETVETLSGVEVNGAGTFTAAPPANLASDRLYSVFFRATSENGSVSESRPAKFYYGQVSAAKIADANEAGFVPGSFSVSIPDAVTEDLAVSYSVGGTAVADQTYAALSGSVVIPAGSTSATIAVTPLLDIFTTADATVSVALDGGMFLVGTATAELSVLNDPSAVTDPTIRFVATDGSDEADGLTAATAFKTVAKAVEDLGASGGRVFIAAGTYVETNAFPSVRSDTSATNQNACVNLQSSVELIGMTGDPADVVITRGTQAARIVYFDHAGAAVRHLTLRGGCGTKDSPGGGAVFITPNGGTIDHCIVEDGDGVSGTVWNPGGGNIYMEGGRVVRSVIRNGNTKSSTGRNGGGAYMTGGVIENCLVYGNHCDQGASVVIDGPGQLLNCTIAGHSASTVAGVKAMKNTAKVVNCAIFGNVCGDDATGRAHVWDGYASAFDHCAGEVAANDSCFAALLGGFVDQEHLDFRLTPVSVCVDRGLDYAATGATSGADVYGSVRVSGQAVDIGAVELQADELAVGFSADARRALCPATVNFTAAVSGAEGGYTCYWDFGDGTAEVEAQNELSASHLYQSCGTFDVTLRVVSGASEKSYVIPGGIFIAPHELFVDAANAEHAAYPYSTRETAATNIRDAVAAAFDGSVIRVADGIYLDQHQIELYDAVRLISESGDPSKCVIRNTRGMGYGAEPARNAQLANAGALLAGFTLANGSGQQISGAAVWVNSVGGTVSNCVVTGARNGNYYGAGAVALNAGRITRCKFSDCQDTDDRQTYGCAISLLGGNAVADNCLVENCGNNPNHHIVYVAGGCTARNLTVVNCLVPDGRAGIGAASSAKVYNCVVAGVTNSVGEVRAYDSDAAAAFYNCAFDADVADGATDCVEGTAATFFKDYAGGDYRPVGGLHNAGDDSNLGGATIDLAGNPRIQGRRSDIGCYEGALQAFCIIIR